MPKAEKGSVKDLANRMKAKGLQKLKFFCQLCQKQCRDANGFKCHMQSDSHLRQMKIFSDNAGGILDQYSRDFESMYLQTLKMRHGTKQVNANNVYQEVIQDKQHVHMNATHWTTLTEFVQYLGKTGKCMVEETERGWMVAFIERDASILARQEAHRKREAADRAAEEAQAQRMEAQRIEAAKALDRVGASLQVEPTALERSEQGAPIKVATVASSGVARNKKKKTVASNVLTGFGEDDDDNDEEEGPPQPTLPQIDRDFRDKTKKRLHETSQSSTNEKQVKRHKKEQPQDATGASDDYWLHKNTVVRVISKKLAGGKYFRKKAVVDRLVDKYTAEVEILGKEEGAGDILRLDQQDLETVIPKKDDRQQKVRILRGKYRGYKASIDYLDKTNFQADLKLVGHHDKSGKRLRDVPYEDFSQVA
jgi:DNA/RNA-binding protein KIN17